VRRWNTGGVRVRRCGVEFIVTVTDKDGTVLDWFDVEYDGVVEDADKMNARAAVLEAAALISDGVF
jgi:hypothetical protein